MAVLLGSASASITLDINQFMGAAKQAEGAMNSLAQAGSGSQPTFLDRLKGSAIGLGTALIGPIGLGIDAAIKLEQSMANVDAALGDVSDNDLSMLADQFNEIAIASQFSATEVAQIGEGLAKAGFDTTELANVTEAVVLLSQATGDGLGPAMDGVVAAMSIWSEEIVGVENALNDATRVSDILTIAANNSTASLTDINAGMRSLGPVAAAMGIGFDESAAAIALFTNYGLKGADAGISLARGLQNLADPSSEAAALMSELGIVAFDAQGSFVGFPDLFRQLQVSMGDMTDQQQLMALSTIFGAEAMDVMGLAILQGAEPLEALIALMQESGAASEQSAIRMDTLGAALGTLKEGVTTFLGSLMQGLIPGLRLLVDGANAFIDILMQIPQPIKTVIGAVAGLLALFAGINIGIGAFSAITGAMGALGIGAGAATLSLGSLLGIVGLVAAAVAGLYLAWKTDFMGMRGIVDQFLAPLRNVAQRVQTAFKGITSFINRFKTAFNGVAAPVEKVSGALGGIADVTKNVMDALAGAFAPVQTFVDAFAGAGERTADALRTIGEAAGYVSGPMEDVSAFFAQTADAATTLGRVFDALAIAIRGINGGEIPGWLSGLADGFEAASDMIDAFMARFEYMRDFLLMSGASPFEAFVGGLRAALGTIDLGGMVSRVINWTADVGVPTIAAFSWDIVGLILDAIGAVLVPLTNVVASLDGAKVVQGTLDLASAVTKFIRDNPIATIAIGAGILSLAFFGVPGLVTVALVGLATLIALAMMDDVPPDVYLKLATTTIHLTNFTFEVADFGAELLVEILGELGKVEQEVNKALAAFKVVAPALNIDWAGMLAGAGLGAQGAILAALGPGSPVDNAINKALSGLGDLVRKHAGPASVGMVEGFNNMFGAGSPLDSGINAALSGLGTVLTAAADPFIKSAEAFASDIGKAFDWIADAWAEPIPLPDLSIPTPNIDWPDAPALAEIPLLTDLAALLGEISAAVEGWSWSFGIPTPNIDWPDPLDWVPQEIKDFLSDPIGFITGNGNSESGDGAGGGGGAGGGTGEPTKLGISSGGVAGLNDLTAQIEKARLAAALFGQQLDTTKLQAQALTADVGAAFAGVETAITGALTRAQFAVSGSVAAIESALTSGLMTAATAAGAAMAGLDAAITGVMTRAQFAVATAMNGITAAMANGGARATQTLANALAPIPGIVSGVGTRAQFAAVTAGNGIATGFGSGAGRAPGLVASALAAVPGIVAGIGGAAAAMAFAVGANIGNAMAAGMRSALGAIQAAAASMVAAAQTALAARAMIQSPSKLFMQMGEYVGEGFALGIRSMIPTAALAAADLVTVPRVTPGQYATPATYGGGGGGATVVNVHVAGSVTTERELTATVTREIGSAIRDDLVRHRIASGVV